MELLTWFLATMWKIMGNLPWKTMNQQVEKHSWTSEKSLALGLTLGFVTKYYSHFITFHYKITFHLVFSQVMSVVLFQKPGPIFTK